MINVTAATTAELVAFYNANSEKPVKKFQDRATAERRVAALIESAPKKSAMAKREEAEDKMLADAYGVTHCPSCKIHLSNGVTTHGDDDIKHEEAQFSCMGCGHEFGKKLSVARSEAIAASWCREDVRIARSQRNGVKVTGGELVGEHTFRSVKAAFEQLNLPLSKHINFRGRLKAAGTLEEFGHHWEII